MNTEDIKKMALALQAVQEASKKKLDPVGKEDGDIDNDGDKDKSDEYLHARRKAVSAAIKGKSMKEEEDRSKLDTFIKNMDGNKLYPATKKRPPTQHVMKAKKDVQKEEVEELDELKKSTLGSYVKKASSDMANNAYNLGARDPLKEPGSWTKAFKRKAGIEKATDKMTKEEVEELDELKKSTMASYAKKASADHGEQIARGYGEYEYGDPRKGDKAFTKADKRKAGVEKAINKLAKEEVDEAKLTDKQVKAALSAAKAQPKDKVSLKPAPWDKKDMKESRWPIYNRIQEAKDAHLKSATAPEAIDSKASKGEKDFVNLHGGLNGNDSGIDGAKAALQTAQSIVAKIKANPKPGGDRNIIKSTEAK
jgi:hypothetical protein